MHVEVRRKNGSKYSPGWQASQGLGTKEKKKQEGIGVFLLFLPPFVPAIPAIRKMVQIDKPTEHSG